MLDVTKPLRAIHATQLARPIKYLCSYNGKHILSHDMSDNGRANLWQCSADGHMEGSNWAIENVPPEPVVHNYVVALVEYKDGIYPLALLNYDALNNHMVGNPGKVVATKVIQITEGEGQLPARPVKSPVY